LNEWDNESKQYIGEKLEAMVEYLLTAEEVNKLSNNILGEDWVILSIKLI